MSLSLREVCELFKESEVNVAVARACEKCILQGVMEDAYTLNCGMQLTKTMTLTKQ
jgi:hypothetical protein